MDHSHTEVERYTKKR